MTEYFDRQALEVALNHRLSTLIEEDGGFDSYTTGYSDAVFAVEEFPSADAVSVVLCKDCKYSTLPSELTQRYGKAGTLTCHNKYSPCNRRNVSENDFCSYGEERGNG